MRTAVAAKSDRCFLNRMQRYLDSVEKADAEQETKIDQSAVQAALEKLEQNAEPEAGFMLVRQQALPAYNIQTAVDTEHALIIAHAVVLDASDIRCLRLMAEAAKEALQADNFKLLADAGYSNGEQSPFAKRLAWFLMFRLCVQ